MRRTARRYFLRQMLAGSTLVCGMLRSAREMLRSQTKSSYRYDLLVKGGNVVDPSQGLSAERVVAISGHRVARVAANIPESEALHVLRADGKIVTPGLIDVHSHVYDGVAPLGIPADPNCVAKGVTTAVDAGSSGAHTFPGLRKYQMKTVRTTYK